MQILRDAEAEITEELYVLRQTRQPVLSAYYVRSAHEMVVDRMCKMIGGNAVGLEQDKILVVLGQLELSLNKVGECDLLLRIAVGKYTQHERVACRKMRTDLVHRKASALEHALALLGSRGVPVGILYLLFFIGLLKLRKLLLGSKAGICLALGNELLCIYVIDCRALALLVRTVCTLFAERSVLIYDHTLVIVYPVIFKCFQKSGYRTLNLALTVGILGAQIENAAALMREPLSCDRLIHTAEMHKARRARCKTCHLGTLRQLSLGKALLKLLRGRINIGEQQLSKLLPIAHFHISYHSRRAASFP